MRTHRLLSALTALAALASLVTLATIGFDRPVAVHFDLAGEPTRVAPAWLALATMPLALATVTLVGRWKRTSGAAHRRRDDLVLVGVGIVLCAAHALIVGFAR